ncbi:dehydrogenase [Pseudoclavibacter chungangensis]|uniref:Dehydrogenase n=1 Tax=Pseudoclavibacter chungangensis TaxID=587635 RepID=A0A7J5BM67_9MICO|nr:Gfo/Idh/MocA family oxidoreductase [Pseudoclavibacter chungangensis]KAB1652303.1 dehydrogenase [Pseudoclavibacter chungangensis]NYJ66915.1 myo-inositol 2-dehydrogenase/D-chiro-inositol 1-dehydrogenase [Pseudoclavibacter chungangensis]
MSTSPLIRLALIGAGRIGSNHAAIIARDLPNAELVAVADPVDGAAATLAESLGVEHSYTDVAELLARPDLDAVVITAPARFHTTLVEQAAAAGKAVFCEKPTGVSLEELRRVEAAVERHGVIFQVGFNRRYANGFPELRAALDAGRLGTPQLLRSVTRDPGLADPAAVRPFTIFLETLIHDFDTLNFFNPGARATSVYAVADALVAPDFKDTGLLDTAVVTIRYDNGAIATAEANFSAAYGYDARAEVFGSAGMATAGELAASSLRLYGTSGAAFDTVRADTQLMRAAYTAELQTFVDAVAGDESARPGTEAALEAMVIALACIESVTSGEPVEVVR